METIETSKTILSPKTVIVRLEDKMPIILQSKIYKIMMAMVIMAQVANKVMETDQVMKREMERILTNKEDVDFNKRSKKVRSKLYLQKSHQRRKEENKLWILNFACATASDRNLP